MVDFIGAVRDPQFRQDVGQGLVNAAGRGLAMIGGAPVDLTTMFLRPLGYSVPDEQIIGSSEYLGRQMADMGLISQARNPVAEFLSALLIPDPTDIQKLAPYVQRAMSADLIAARPSTPGAAMRAQRGSVGVEPQKLTSSRFSEDNRLSNLNPKGPSWERIRENNPALRNLGPDDDVTIYRATVGQQIRPDDFVAVDKSTLAKELKNVRARDGKDAKIIKQKVKVRDLLMGNDATEFVYFPTVQTNFSPPRPQAPREEALRIAQENAAKPVSEGGLGLPPDNTAMRAQRGSVGVEPLTVGDISNKWSEKGVALYVFEPRNQSNTITLSKIEVPEDARKSGLGTQAMNDIVEYANKTGKTITLSPSTDFGASSKKRLVDFYKRFGFVENKGKNKDFSISESMYRLPDQQTR